MDKPTKEVLVSTQELADVLGTSKQVIANAVKKLDNVLCPVLRNTQGGYLFNEKQVTLIKQEIQGHHNLQLRQIDDISTELEENELILKSMTILQQRNIKLKKENARLNSLIKEKDQQILEHKPKLELLNKISETKNLYSMKQVAELLQLPYGRNTLLAILRDKGYLNSNNEPYQRYSKYFVYKILYKESLQKNVGYTLVTNAGLEYINKIVKD